MHEADFSPSIQRTDARLALTQPRRRKCSSWTLIFLPGPLVLQRENSRVAGAEVVRPLAALSAVSTRLLLTEAFVVAAPASHPFATRDSRYKEWERRHFTRKLRSRCLRKRKVQK